MEDKPTEVKVFTDFDEMVKSIQFIMKSDKSATILPYDHIPYIAYCIDSDKIYVYKIDCKYINTSNTIIKSIFQSKPGRQVLTDFLSSR